VPSYRGHRFPVEIISHCVWLYYRFPLSFREVEELMLERGQVPLQRLPVWFAQHRVSRAGQPGLHRDSDRLRVLDHQHPGPGHASILQRHGRIWDSLSARTSLKDG